MSGDKIAVGDVVKFKHGRLTYDVMWVSEHTNYQDGPLHEMKAREDTDAHHAHRFGYGNQIVKVPEVVS